MSSADLNALPSILNLSKTTKGEVKSEPLETFTLSRLKEINHADKEVADDLIFTSPQHAAVVPLLRALWIDEGSKDNKSTTLQYTTLLYSFMSKLLCIVLVQFELF